MTPVEMGQSGSATVRDGLTLHPNWQTTEAQEHSLGGHLWSFRYLPARYHKRRMVDPPGVCLSVTIPGSFGGSVLVVPEDAWDRVVRATGLSREFQTDTPDVDAAFMLSGKIGDELGRFFRSPTTHQSLRELFAVGFTRIECFNNQVKATCRPWRLDLPDAEPPDTFRRVVVALTRLKAGLSSMPGSALTSASTFHHAVASPKPQLWVLGGFLASLGIGVLVIAAHPLKGSELFSRLGGPSLAAGVAVTALVAALSRGYAFRGRTLVAALFAVFAVVLSASFTTLGYLNTALDPGRAVQHSELVMAKRMSSGRSTSYYVRTPSWRPDHSTEEFSVSKADWTRAQIGTSTYVVHSKPGYFGIEWIVDRTLYP